MDVVNAIKQDDLITKITIVRKGADAKKFDATKIFSDYIANKTNEDKMEAELAGENKRKAAEAEAAKKADIIMILINDELQAKLYKESIEKSS